MKFPSKLHASRVALNSARTFCITAFLAPWLSLVPPYASRRKYLITDRLAYVPQVNGGASSLIPFRFIRAGPEHGSSNSREDVPCGFLDHITFSTLSGPGVNVMDPRGPCQYFGHKKNKKAKNVELGADNNGFDCNAVVSDHG